jgi:hypothetical protein
MKPLATVGVALASFAAGVGLTVLVLPRWAALQATKPQPTADQTQGNSTTCWLNQLKQTCVITPVGTKGAFQISFSAGDKPFFVFTPEGPPTTDNRPMRDAQGRRWLFSGNSSFTLTEQGGFKNVISVASN